MKRVLCIDDDQDILVCMDFILTDEGYQIQTADSPKNIFKLIADFKPDLILLDIQLGAYDGLEICRYLTANLTTKNIPVIMVSGHESVARYKEFGAIDRIQKPFDMEHLATVVNSYLEAKIIQLNPPAGSDEQAV